MRSTAQSDKRSPNPGSSHKGLVLASLAILLVVALAIGAVALIGYARGTGLPHANRASAPTSAYTSSPTPDPADPASNGWRRVSPAKFGDVQFAASDLQRGYLCGSQPDASNPSSEQHVFGVTSDGGATWSVTASPARYTTCWLHVAPTDPLRLTLVSTNAPGDGQSAYIEAHFSTDGGKSWSAAPFPTQAIGPGDTLWAGTALYVVLTQNKDNPGQKSTILVSRNGGAFTSIDLGALSSDLPDVTVGSAFASSARLYLNISGNGCADGCERIVTSDDGGMNWTALPIQSMLHLDAVVEHGQSTALFATAQSSQPFLTGVERSLDGGVTWTALPFPALPGSPNIQSYTVAPDMTVVVSTLDGVSLLQNGQWTTLRVSTKPSDSVSVTAVTLGADGSLATVWGHDEGNNPGVYWHPL